MNVTHLKNRIIQLLLLGFIGISSNLSFTNTAYAWPDYDCGGEENCMVIIGPRLTNPGIGIPGFGGGGGGGGGGGDGGGGGGQFDPPPPNETFAQCVDRINERVKVCESYSGIAGSIIISTSFCRKVGRIFPSYRRPCMDLISRIPEKRTSIIGFCRFQGKEERFNECK